ncbi:MAG TPA: ABC transporter substrate-binding protein, partial [Bacteroidales bacterium]|nr:ABC transporter substrate-binding protein [Bacteroidales bacterium]
MDSFASGICNMIRKLLYLAIIILLLPACRGRNEGGHAEFTIAALKGPSAMGMIRLIDSLNSSPGHPVEVQILNEPLQVRKMMLDGTADFAILPTTMASILYNKGLKYKLIGIPCWGTLYLAGSDTLVSSWEDLRNKRIYVMARGMTPDVMFRHLLGRNGLDPGRDVILDYSFPTHIDLANAVAAGQAPLGILSEPLASLVTLKNRDIRIIFNLEKEWSLKEDIEITETAFLGRENILRHKPDLVERIIKSYTYSSEWVNRYPDSAAVLIVKYGILPDTAVAAHAIPGSNLRFVRAAEKENEIEDYLNVFYKLNPDIIGGKLPDENFIYR